MAGYFLPEYIFVNANMSKGIKPPERIATIRAGLAGLVIQLRQ
ncbi:hypothetical protein ABQZ69_07730 [Xanthomonas sp. WHRI 8391]